MRTIVPPDDIPLLVLIGAAICLTLLIALRNLVVSTLIAVLIVAGIFLIIWQTALDDHQKGLTTIYLLIGAVAGSVLGLIVKYGLRGGRRG